MKKKASALLKQVVTLLSSIARAKATAIKNKTSAMKTRLLMFSLVKNKKLLLGSISNKIHNLLAHKHSDEEDDDRWDGDLSKAIVLYNAATLRESRRGVVQDAAEGIEVSTKSYFDQGYNFDDDKYPDLTHCLFDEEDLDFEDQSGSIIDIVKNSKEEGENFSLEDEIDHVADLFIKRFHNQMRLQKLLSFKRYQEMLERSV